MSPVIGMAANVEIEVPGYGNCERGCCLGRKLVLLGSRLMMHRDLDLTLNNLEVLTGFTWAIRQALRANGISGDGGHEIDHIELFGPPQNAEADSRNFVLCPGKAYDRSPCGTGTSAKLACLYADGRIREGQTWIQESIIGSVFKGTIKTQDGKVYPSITGSAFVNAEAELLLDPDDPLCMGIRG